mgnify:CR=1 FL=1
MSRPDRRNGAVGEEVNPATVFENGLPPATPEEKTAWIALLEWRIEEYDPEIHPSPVWSEALDEVFDYQWLAFAVEQLDAEHASVFRKGVDTN